MSDTIQGKTGLTRRSFLKTTAVTAGMAAVVGASATNTLQAFAETKQNNAAVDEEIYFGQCRGNCMGGCRLKIRKRDGNIANVDMAEFPIPEYNRICSKGISHPQRVYNSERVKYPMRRVAGTARGEGVWERISWEEAIDDITSKWKELQEKYGKNCIVISQGTGSQGKIGYGGYNYLARLTGASTTNGNFDGAGLGMSVKVVGMTPYLAGNTHINDMDAKTVLLWGCNPAEANVVDFKFVMEAHDRGAKLIHVDPVYSITSSKCDQFVPIKPGTDTAFFLSLIKVCADNDWIDRDFLIKNTVAPYLVKENGKYLRMSDLGVAPTEGPISTTTGKPTMIDPIVVWDADSQTQSVAGQSVNPAIEGTYDINGFKVSPAYQLLVDTVQEWTPEKAETVCDIPADTIVEIADRVANMGPTTLWCGFGVDHYAGGHKGYHAALALFAITGNYGKKGAGMSGTIPCQLSYAVNNPKIATVKGVTPGPSIPNVKLTKVFDTKKLGDVPVDMHSFLLAKSNALANITNRLDTLRMYNGMDLVVVADHEMTDTARHADYVLPTAGWFEYEDIVMGNQTPFINIQEKAIEPLYESKPDYEIAQLLAKGMGFDMPWTAAEFLDDHFDNKLAQMYGFTMDRLRKEKVFVTAEGGLEIQGAGGKYTTPTGKFEFYLEDVSRSIAWEGADDGDVFDESLEHLPHFEPPMEAWEENPLFAKYPLIFTSIRNRFRTHTQFYSCDWMRELRPEATIRLSPQDAAARDIKTGDMVRAYNDRGEMVARAEINNGIRAGMVVYPKGFQAFEHVKGCSSDLTSNHVHPAFYNNYYFDALCEVEKYEGA
ncbi:molybdopterin-dependent oxidoreductase [Adlercreutzia sp. ZJ304]|uniref:molybdopterin-dependent oxidoreductase n=1 Tax=Adlercreutzia sp. ZJ304 TaxID=2709791 RepID=UPI0013E9A606|nr:molybdopterin-dependent oxidoreductase [Adlercreutzia sp. ZJ304]